MNNIIVTSQDQDRGTQVLENPVGIVELTDEALDDLIGSGVADGIESGSCAWFSCNGA